MSIGIPDQIERYLKEPEITTRLLVVVEYNDETVYRFIVDESVEEVEIGGEIYQSASITRSDREENSDMSIETLSLTLSNHWQGWAAILANQGNNFINKPCKLYEWLPDFPDEPPLLIYEGVLDNISMTASTFDVKVVRSLGDYQQDSPNMTFDPNCQYQFKDERCGYVGAYFDCGKTLEDCINRHNEEHFGGHPSVPRETVIRS